MSKTMANTQTNTDPVTNERINLRLKSSAKNILERAARFEGKTLTNFILNCALSGAEKTIFEHEAINLNIRESEAFYHALDQPISFNKKLHIAFDDHEKYVDSK